MVMDFRILTLNDNNDLSKSFELLSIVKDISFGRAYRERYKFLSELTGEWYSVLPQHVDNIDYVEKMDEFCDVMLNYENSAISPIWANSQMIEYSLFPLIVHEKYYSDFCNIVYHMLKSCSSHIILFLLRFSEIENEIIGGIIPIKKFMRMLEKHEILCGACYIITME